MLQMLNLAYFFLWQSATQVQSLSSACQDIFALIPACSSAFPIPCSSAFLIPVQRLNWAAGEGNHLSISLQVGIGAKSAPGEVRGELVERISMRLDVPVTSPTCVQLPCQMLHWAYSISLTSAALQNALHAPSQVLHAQVFLQPIGSDSCESLLQG